MNKRKKIIYISGPYSEFKSNEGITYKIEDNIKIARKIAIRLWEKGFTVICPHLNTIHFEKDSKLSYDDYIDGDLEILSRCDAIYMTPFYDYSSGAKKEKEHAKKIGIEIFDNESQIEKWVIR